MAMLQFLGIPELLDLLGEQITSRGLLYRLCFVNRAFHTAFKSHMYKRLSWDAHNITFLIDEEKQQLLLHSGNLVYTQDFVILDTAIDSCLKEWQADLPLDQLEQQTWGGWYSSCQETVYTEICNAITKLLPHLINVRSFRSCKLALSSECMIAISMCSTLSVLSISFPSDSDSFIGFEIDGQVSDIDNPRRVASFGNISPNFTLCGLRELSLHNLWGDIKSWRQKILQVMSHSLELEHVSLSIAMETAERLAMLEAEEDENDSRFYLNMFQWLCHEYTARMGTPLKLKSVQLGYGIRFYNLASMEGEFDASSLEKLHVHNCYSDPPIYTVPWDLLLVTKSPKLRRISFSELNQECLELIPRNLARDIPVGLRLGSDNLDDSTDSTPSIYSWLAGNVKFQPSQLILPNLLFYKTADLSPLCGNSWITALSYRLYVYQDYVSSPNFFEEHLSAPSAILATFKALKYFWITTPVTGTLIPIYVVERIAAVCRSLCYIRTNRQTWRISRRDDSAGNLLEMIDEWEDENTGLEFFQWGAEIALFE